MGNKTSTLPKIQGNYTNYSTEANVPNFDEFSATPSISPPPEKELQHDVSTSREACKGKPLCRPRLDYADPAVQASMSSPLLRLPPEIRFLIWEYAMTSDTGMLHYSAAKGHFNVSTIGAGLLTVCRLTSHEVFYHALLLNKLVLHLPTAMCVKPMVFWRNLQRIEDEFGWRLEKAVVFTSNPNSPTFIGENFKKCLFQLALSQRVREDRGENKSIFVIR